MSLLDKKIEEIRIRKATQGYELAELVLKLNKAKSTEEMMFLHKKMVALALQINGGPL